MHFFLTLSNYLIMMTVYSNTWLLFGTFAKSFLKLIHIQLVGTLIQKLRNRTAYLYKNKGLFRKLAFLIEFLVGERLS